jgi:hypothetical protein
VRAVQRRIPLTKHRLVAAAHPNELPPSTMHSTYSAVPSGPHSIASGCMMQEEEGLEACRGCVSYWPPSTPRAISRLDAPGRINEAVHNGRGRQVVEVARDTKKEEAEAKGAGTCVPGRVRC